MVYRSLEIAKRDNVGGLDFSRFDDITDSDVIGRPLEADEAEQIAIQTVKEAVSANELHQRSEPSDSEVWITECCEVLNYNN